MSQEDITVGDGARTFRAAQWLGNRKPGLYAMQVRAILEAALEVKAKRGRHCALVTSVLQPRCCFVRRPHR